MAAQKAVCLITDTRKITVRTGVETMRLENIRADLRLLAGALVLPLVVACDSGVSVVPDSGTSSSQSNDSVIEDTVVGVESDVADVTGDTAGMGAQVPECIDTPPVGDGWGWNGTESCRVDATTDTTTVVVDTEVTVAPTDNTGSQVAECIDTPPVGDGWGWNGSESCRVGGAPIDSAPIVDTTPVSTPPVVSPPVVSDTTGTQGSGSQPQDTTTFNTSPELITDLVLVTGQSNALGAGTSFDEFLDAPDRRVMAYTNQGWQVASLNQVWDRNWFPRNDPSTPPSNNFSLHFGKRVAERTPDRVVGFILVTSPGSRISDWGPDSALFESIRDRVSQAINDIPLKSRLDAILWHQGESDGEDRDEYSAALYDLITRFRSEPWFDDGRPFICGETAGSPVNNQLNRLNTDADPWTACVEGEGLAVLPGTDHFNASSLRTIGQRYADEYLRQWLGIE